MKYYTDKDLQVMVKRVLANLCKDEAFVAKIKAKLIQNISNNKSLDDTTKAYQIKLVKDDEFLKPVLLKVIEKCQTDSFAQDLVEEIICGINDFIDVVEDELKLL